jgi:hypothetical protein
MNTSGSTWGRIFWHLPIMLNFGCYGLLAWTTLPLEGEDRLFFVVLEEKEDEVVELTKHSFVGDIWQPIPWERAPEFRNKIILFGPSKCIVT